jgi:hypothetical protein
MPAESPWRTFTRSSPAGPPRKNAFSFPRSHAHPSRVGIPSASFGERAPLADVLGLVENLERRLAAHESEMEKVYYPGAAPLLTPDEWRLLRDSAPPP